MRLSVQGGIGNADENDFLLTCYNVDATGWGSPFLLCPDVTAVDEEHLAKLSVADDSDVYLSNSSPLGLPFWNLRTSASESLRRKLVADGRPGSSCPKGHLKHSTEFTKLPLCTASRTYLKKKFNHLPEEGLGVRIENDFLITADGAENMAADLPATADDVEALMRGE